MRAPWDSLHRCRGGKSLFCSNSTTYKNSVASELPVAILLPGSKKSSGIKPNNNKHDRSVEKRGKQGAHDISHSFGWSQACSPPCVEQSQWGWGAGQAGAPSLLSCWIRLPWFLSLPDWIPCSDSIFFPCPPVLLSYPPVLE